MGAALAGSGLAERTMIELVAGANMPLPGGAVRLELPGPFDLSAVVVGAGGTVSGDGDFVFYNQPAAPGVRLAPPAGLTVEVGALRPGAERVIVVASPDDLRTPFGRLPAPAATVRDAGGGRLAVLRPPRLGSETVLVVAEIYRRAGSWKLRCVGQGYADGLAGLARDYGVDVEDDGSGDGSGGGSDGNSGPGGARRVAGPGASPAPAPVTPAPLPAQPGPDRSVAPLLAGVVTLTNAERTRRGLVALAVEPRLTAAAQAHSDDMARRHFFAHESPEGQSVADRARARGYVYRIVAENIAAGQRTAEEVVTGWMNSPGHRANILNGDLRQIGVGYALGGEYGTTWTQVFGTPMPG